MDGEADFARVAGDDLETVFEVFETFLADRADSFVSIHGDIEDHIKCLVGEV